MASLDDALAILGLITATEILKTPTETLETPTETLETRPKKRKGRVWVKDPVKRQNTFSHADLLSELRFAPKEWPSYLRMNEESYFKLLSLVAPLIQKQDTLMRTAISPHERLTATLRYLATGKSFEDLKFSTGISSQALGIIIPETCEAIYDVLHKDYLKFPQTEEEWIEIADAFEEKWNFPHCLGAMDGKHVDIMRPAGSGSTYHNYKGRHSMVLLAIANAKHEFIMCDFGTNGRVSDGGDLLDNTKFFKKLQEKKLNIPGTKKIGNTDHDLPYVFVADDAFPLREDIMKPFREVDLNTEQRKNYNYRVCRARKIIENVFEMLASRFKIFFMTIKLKPHKIESIVMACCVLHNFLIKSAPSYYSPPDCFDREDIDDDTILGLDTENSPLIGLRRNHSGSTGLSAANIREKFMSYFNTDGQVPWQSDFI